MTIIEQFIEETHGIEKAIREAVKAAKITRLAGDKLRDECIRMMVDLQVHGLLMAQRQQAIEHQQPGIVVPDSRMAV